MAKFQKGQSGNPAGKPKGARDKRTELRALLEPHAEKLINKVVALALEGDTTALRICVDRLIAPVKPRDVPVNMGKIEGSLADQGRTILGALSGGSITPDEAVSLMQAVAAQARIIEVDEFERRISRLESTQQSRP